MTVLGLDPDQTLRFVYLMVLRAGIVGLGWRGRQLSTSLRQGAVWVLIFVGVLTAYTYRASLTRFAEPVLRELTPSRVVDEADEAVGEFSVGRSADGHFRLDIQVNGTAVRFLVDTGASSTVLTSRDAERSGIAVAALSFDKPVETANGSAFYAGATLATLQLGPLTLNDVPAAVAPEGALSTSLLGMSVIRRFRSWRIEGDRLVFTR